jgi:hypothetical protein
VNGYEIKLGTAATPLLFLLISSSDHVTALTGKAATVVVKISKNGGAYAAPAGAVSEIGLGLYQVAGNATDTGTLGPLWLNALDPASDPTDVCYRVVAYDPAAASNLGLSALPTAVPASAGGLPTCDAADGVKLSVGTGAGQVNVAAGKVPATIAAGDAANLDVAVSSRATVAGVWDEPVANHQTGGTTGVALTSGSGGGTSVQATWSFDNSTVAADPGTGDFRFSTATPSTATALYCDALTAAGTDFGNYFRGMATGDFVTIQDQANAANWVKYTLAGAPTDHTGWWTLAVTYLGSGGTLPGNRTACEFLFRQATAGDPWAAALPGAYAAGSAGAILGGRLDVLVSSRSTYAGGPVASVTSPVTVGGYSGAGDPWTIAVPGAYAPGSAGAIVGGRLDAAVSTRSTYAGGPVASVTGTVGSVTGPVTVGGYSSGQDPATLVLDVAMSLHVTAGSVGAAIAAGQTGADPWTTLLPGAYGAGTAGAILGTRLDAAVSTRSTYAGGAVASVTAPVTVGGYAGGAAPADPWAAALPGSYAPTTAGGILGGRLDAAVSTRSTYAGSDTPGTSTLLSRLTAPRATNLDNLDAAVSTRSTYAGGPVASVTAPVAVASNQDKSGYALAPTGLDAIPTTAPAGVAGTFREMIVAVWRKYYRRAVKDMTTATIRTFADDGTTILTTQPFADDGAGNETLGSAT